MNSDLTQLRQWRTGRADRVLRLHGHDGAQGVTLIELDFGQRRTASYSSAAAAVNALASGAVRWKVAASEPEGSSWSRVSAVESKRKGGRRGGGRRKLAKTRR